MDSATLFHANFDELVRFVSAGPEENHSLEFKRKTDPTSLELHKDDRRLLGEVLSGFANATGGLLVLGVETEKHQGIDRAKSINLISDAANYASRVRSYATDCVAPVVEGVEVRSVTNAEGAGFVLVSVPRGHARPHMSTAPGHHTYYRRVMDSFVPMEAYEVEEMMRLKTEPKLEFIYAIRASGSVGSNRMYVLLFGLANRSRVTAKFPYISYRREPDKPNVAKYGLDGNGNDLWPKVTDVAAGGVMFVAGADRVLHPGQELYVSKIDYTELDDNKHRDWGVSRLGDDQVLSLQFRYGCEDSPMEMVELRLTKQELLAR
jgi:hypothetical protein